MPAGGAGCRRSFRASRAARRTRCRGFRRARRRPRSPRACSRCWRRRGATARVPTRFAELRQAFEVFLERIPDLDLEHPEAPPEVLVGFRERLRDRLDADRDRGREGLVDAAEHLGKRDAEALRQGVVEGDVDGRPRGGRQREALLGLAAERGKRADVAAPEPLEVRGGERRAAALDRLSGDVLAGRAGAEADDPGVRLDTDDDVADVGRRAPGPRSRTDASARTARGRSRGGGSSPLCLARQKLPDDREKRFDAFFEWEDDGNPELLAKPFALALERSPRHVLAVQRHRERAGAERPDQGDLVRDRRDAQVELLEALVADSRRRVLQDDAPGLPGGSGTPSRRAPRDCGATTVPRGG